VLLALSCSTSLAQKVPVYVYYESLCPDSQAFIINQLYPTMQQMKNYVYLNLIPFGRSTYSTSGADVNFQCKHGPNECYGNKVQACAIDHIQVDSFQNENTKESLTLSYIHCLMSKTNNFPDAIYPTRRCADEVQVKNPDVIEQCANSTEGSKLLQKMGEETNKLDPPLDGVPTITIKTNKFDSNFQKLALVDLRNAICNNLAKPVPVECRAGNSASAKVLSVLLIAVSAIFAFLRS
jgi:hypothetical protein